MDKKRENKIISWDVSELKNICEEKNLPYPAVYINSLEWKRVRAEFHAEQSRLAWANLFSSGREISDDSQEWKIARFTDEVNVEAAAYALHSLGDILAQIINQILLGSYYTEDQVSLYKVRDILNDQQAASQVVSAINQMINSDEWKYISAFVNTIKHRRLLNTNYRMVSNENSHTEGIQFMTFSFKGSNYPQAWGNDIVDTYKNKIYNHISKIGNAINDYLYQLS